jgi:putative membrane protein
MLGYFLLMIGRFLIKIVASALALLAADLLIAGFAVVGGVAAYAFAGLVLALLNTFIKPIIRLFSLPFIWITLGLFSLVINGFLLWLASQWADAIMISGLVSLAWATLIVSLVLSLVGSTTDND